MIGTFASWGEPVSGLEHPISLRGRAHPARYISTNAIVCAFVGLCIWVLVWRLSGATYFLSAIFNSVIPETLLAYLPEALIGLPVAFLLFLRATNGSLLLPGWVLALAFEAIVLLREILATPAQEEVNWGYGYGVLLIYISFVALLNVGVQMRNWDRMRRAFWAAAAIMIAAAVAIVITPLQIDVGPATDVNGSLGATRGMIGTAIQVNGFAFTLAVAAGLLLGKRREGRGSLTIIDGMLLSGAFMIVAFLASRGAMILFSSLVFFHVFGVSDDRIRLMRLLVAVSIVAVSILMVAAFLTLTPVGEKIFVVQRLLDPGEFISRPQQVYATWVRFLDAPVFGHGTEGVARDALFHIERSNFHPTQVLAAYGIVGFIPWAILMFKLFFSGLNPHRWLIAGVALSFYNWSVTMPLAVVAVWDYRESAELRDG